MNLDERIKYIDFHTHHGSGRADTVAIVNLMAGESVPDKFSENTLFSAGIHPWHLTEENADSLRYELILTMAHPHVVALGEGGLDTMHGPDEKLQYDLFCYQAELAEELKKPLIIHCVRAWDNLRKAKKELCPSTIWVIHGFRGKKSLAQNLVEEGFLFSLGMEGLSEEIISAIGTDKLFLETDDSDIGIEEVYLRFTAVTGIEQEEACKILRNNFNRYIGE